jgi:N-methylhydantoinase A/oxoprolinase/acetone carboxylase beta subunit
MEGLARGEMEQEGLPVDRMNGLRFLDVRYVGQSFELTIDYPAQTRRSDDARMRRIITDSFYRAHMQRFGYADRSEAVEIVNLRLKMGLELDKPQVALEPAGPADASHALAGSTEVVFPGGRRTAPLYDRDQLRSGNQFTGPTIVLQMDTTIVVPPGWNGMVDPGGNLILEPAAS